jgi:FMN-dependent NADH-azoreductase
VIFSFVVFYEGSQNNAYHQSTKVMDMSTLLHVDSSVRAANNPNPDHDSISKNIARRFIDTWKQNRSEDEYIYRDVGVNPPAFITQDWIGAVFTPEEKITPAQQETLALSDKLIAEVAVADVILISSPMYNYGMPAQLKAWFDQIVRINKTFDFDLSRGDFPLQPLLSGKTLIIVTSTGEFGFEKGGIREDSGHLTPHLRTLSKYLGVDTIYEITSEYQEFGDERHHISLANAKDQAESLASELSGSTRAPSSTNEVANV